MQLCDFLVTLVVRHINGHVLVGLARILCEVNCLSEGGAAACTRKSLVQPLQYNCADALWLCAMQQHDLVEVTIKIEITVTENRVSLDIGCMEFVPVERLYFLVNYF